MNGPLGHAALALAAVLALLQSFAGLAGHRAARPLAMAHGLAALAALGVLGAAFVLDDFGLRYVAEHSSRALPAAYRFAAVWGGHEGSLLLWSATLGAWCVALAWAQRTLASATQARQLGVAGVVASAMLAFLWFTADPFAAAAPQADGLDLQPLLQHPGMAIHPPLLYLGTVGLVVPFAFAVASLLEGRFDLAAAQVARRWTALAWSALTLGIVVGSLWAYEVLGWGGWWFWDPVENASLMPWLVATALLHAMAASTKRLVLIGWTLLLAILGFALTLLGTFVVRSGVLSSVHAFASDTARGAMVLTMMSVLCGAALLLFAWRAPTLVAREGGVPRSRREALLGINGALLVLAMGLVLAGTLAPLVGAALGTLGTSVGPGYFDRVLWLPMALLMLLLGSLPALLSTAHGGTWRAVARGLTTPAGVAVLLGFVIATAFDLPTSAWVALGLATWVAASVLVDIAKSSLRRERPHAATLAMWLAHLGVAVFAFGLGTVKTLEVQRDATVAVGETVELGGYRFRLLGFHSTANATYDALQAGFEVERRGTTALLLPEKRIYRIRHQATTVAAIDRSLARDVIVSLGEPVGNRAWTVRLYVKPFVSGLWLGGLLMAAGGALAAWARRLGQRDEQTQPWRHEVTSTAALAPLVPPSA